jgi:glycosyltransferase involved in cell wall biosynthesis
MACGTPTLISGVPPFPEVTRGAALMADPLSTQDLAKGLERICFDQTLRAKLSHEGAEITRLYRWDKTAANLIELYERTFS